MKLSQSLKRGVLLTLLTLYLTGAVTWLISSQEPSAFRMWWLQIHSVISLWFIFLFGYLMHAHVLPSWRRGRRLKSGVALTGGWILLCLTVPFLFYASQESVKEAAAQVHTYLGLAMIVPFLTHYFLRD